MPVQSSRLKTALRFPRLALPCVSGAKALRAAWPLSYEKEALLEGLFARVQACSTVDIMAETRVLGAENTAGGARVLLRSRGGKEFSVAGRVAVAADGVNSRIVESLGLNTTRRKFFARFRVTSYHLAGVECPYPESWVTFIGKGHTLGGRGQLYFCPKPHGGQYRAAGL